MHRKIHVSLNLSAKHMLMSSELSEEYRWLFELSEEMKRCATWGNVMMMIIMHCASKRSMCRENRFDRYAPVNGPT